MDRLLILGARQHAKVIVAIVKECYANSLEVVGYLDDNPELAGTSLLGYPIIDTLAHLEPVIAEHKITAGIVGISNRYMKLREQLYLKLKKTGLKIPSVIHSSATVSTFAKAGEGTLINPGVVINAFACVGNNCVLYSNATVEHETVLSDNVYLGAGVAFSSNARVGKNTFIGVGAHIIPDVEIGSDVIVGAGSVVIGNIENGSTVAGVPARVINRSSQSRI